MEKNIIKMKKSYTVAELANLWYNITTTYKLAKKAHLKEYNELTSSLYATASTNMAIVYDFITTKIEPDDMVKVFDYLAGINRNCGNDNVGLWK